MIYRCSRAVCAERGGVRGLSFVLRRDTSASVYSVAASTAASTARRLFPALRHRVAGPCAPLSAATSDAARLDRRPCGVPVAAARRRPSAAAARAARLLSGLVAGPDHRRPVSRPRPLPAVRQRRRRGLRSPSPVSSAASVHHALSSPASSRLPGAAVPVRWSCAAADCSPPRWARRLVSSASGCRVSAHVTSHGRRCTSDAPRSTAAAAA